MTLYNKSQKKKTIKLPLLYASYYFYIHLNISKYLYEKALLICLQNKKGFKIIAIH